MTNVQLKCSCGAVRGVARKVSPNSGNRCVCYCDDCQAFARFLGRERDILDAHGGTDIYQLTPAQIRITSGTDLLGCVRLSPKGTYRWYTECCRTPVANTLSANVPFVGLIHNFMDDEGERDRNLGPVRYYVQGQYALGTPDVPKIYRKVPRLLMVRYVFRLLLDRVLGRHRPSPFFDQAGKPVAEPIIRDKGATDAVP